MSNNTKGNSKVLEQLAEYRRRQAEKYKEVGDDEQESRQALYQQEEIPKQNSPKMQKLPNPPPPITTQVDNNEYDADLELAQRLQDEENQRASGNFHQNSSINSFGENNQPYTENPPLEEDGVRQADNYRQDTLIPDPVDEEMARLEFIRQQQMLYNQYSGNGNNPQQQPVENNLRVDFQDAGSPLLLNRNIPNNQNHTRREIWNCVFLGILFSILLTTMFLILYLM